MHWKRMGLFQICLILEARFEERPIIDDLSKFQVRLLHEETSEVGKIIFCLKLRTLTKGWYLGCYKYWRRNHNVHPINYFC